MGNFLERRMRGISRLPRSPWIACALACAASAAGPDPPRPASGSVVEYGESPPSGVLYHEESGGLITPLAKPSPGSGRKPLPPLPARDAKAAGSRAPVVSAPAVEGKTRVGKSPGAPGAAKPAVKVAAPAPAAVSPSLVAPQPVAKTEEEIRQERRREYETLLAGLFDGAAPPVDRARRIDEAAGSLVVSFRDAGTAARLGWLWLEGKDPASAALWFQRARTWRPGDEEATQGLAIASLAERNFAAALALADELPEGSAARREARLGAWIGIGQGEYAFGRYGGAIEAFDRAAAAGELPRYVRMLRAWSRLKAGDATAAAADFALLYRESPDLEAAQGVLAAVPSGPLPVDAVVASTEPLASLMRERKAGDAFRSRRFLEARSLDPSRWGSLGSPGVLAAMGAIGRREKSGQEGSSRLSTDFAPVAGVSFPVGAHAAVSVRTERATLDAGIIEPGATLGSAPEQAIPLAAAPVRATLRESTASLRWEHGVAILATAGDGVKGGVVSARPTGSVDVAATPEWGQAQARAYAEPVRESVLAWAGMADPHGGPAWGGVRRLGVEARALYLGSAPYSAGLQVRAERLVGTRVAANERRAIDASLGRDLGLPGFAYSSLGFAAGHDAYEKNLSHYTLGHGGYFSPQSYRKAGLAFDFMTEEGKAWLVRGRASAARTWKREDAAPYLPLESGARAYDGSRSRGHEASVRLGAVAQLSPRIQAGFAFGRGVSPQWSEKFAFLEVRVLFEPRRGVVSSDLPVVRGD